MIGRHRLAARRRGLADADHRSGRVPRRREARSRAGRGLRLHAEGRRPRHPARRHADRFRVRHPHRGRAPVHRRQGQRSSRLPRRHRLPGPVEVVTAKVPSAGPSRDWLQIVATPRARNKIRQWFSRERREDVVDTGRGGDDQGAAAGGAAGPAHRPQRDPQQVRRRRSTTRISMPCTPPSARATSGQSVAERVGAGVAGR